MIVGVGNGERKKDVFILIMVEIIGLMKIIHFGKSQIT